MLFLIKFIEHEAAILEVGTQLQAQTQEPISESVYNQDSIDVDSSTLLSDDPETEKILSAELKSLIKQELSLEQQEQVKEQVQVQTQSQAL